MLEPEYKSLSLLAVAAFIAAAIGSASFLHAPLIVVAAAALLVAMIALRTTRKYQMSGHRLALLATAIAVASIVLSPLWHDYLYRSETLLGHVRIELDTTLKANGLDRYNGKRVCLKGYSLYYGGDTETNMFPLSPDGNFRKPETAVTVVLPKSWKFQIDPIAVSGILRVDPAAPESVQRYTLEAVKISNAKTSYLLAPRMPGGC
jgi:hypothetical protein